MTLEYERNAYTIVAKRILKSNLSKNPAKLLEYKRDIIAAHNRILQYVLSKYATSPADSQKIYRDNLRYILDKTKACFKNLKFSYSFSESIFEFIVETESEQSGESSNQQNDDQQTNTSDTGDSDEFLTDVENTDDETNDNNDNQQDDNNQNEDNNRQDDNNQNNNNDQDNENQNNEMVVSKVEFLNFASKVIPFFDGTPANLLSFTDALTLANESVETHLDSLISLIKTKLIGDARTYISNEATVQAIIDKLKASVKAESTSLIMSKMMNITQSKKKANDYVKEIESLTTDLRRAYITEGLPVNLADSYATKGAVQAMKANASSERVKLLMEAGNFQTLNEAVDKFVSSATAELTNNSGNASINYINRRPFSNNFRGGRPHYRNNYRRNNYYNNNRQNNSRGSGNRNYYRGNNQRRGNNNNRRNNSNPVRVTDIDRNDNDQGNLQGPQQIPLRDA